MDVTEERIIPSQKRDLRDSLSVATHLRAWEHQFFEDVFIEGSQIPEGQHRENDLTDPEKTKQITPLLKLEPTWVITEDVTENKTNNSTPQTRTNLGYNRRRKRRHTLEHGSK